MGRLEYDQCMRSAAHHRKRNLARHFADWHAVVAELCQLRQRMFFAMSHECRILVHVAFTQWCFYFSRLQKKRRSPHVQSAVSSIIVMRRRQRFQSWVKISAALTHSGRAQHKFAVGARIVFRAWVDVIRLQSEMSDYARAALLRRCDFQQRHEDFLDRKRENSLVSAFHCFRRVATRKQ
eukprot:CAMPEP_0169147944 /NCGR_PEP_ID=MMETSP1015-20121227/48544_1 /TAXON_ID=342587 /ORGANISM="Karlodinium micrum, Strain CCMP2283" /LENGTH=179 /DNA_ID=CAMNT_0009216293 /DNA_START=399 /DNA_END=935 /DNA_ORIENTATION=+